MARKKASPRASKDNGANLGFEAKLWLAADKLRNNMDAAEYKHVVLGLIFLKYISDAFEEMHERLIRGGGEYEGADPEDPDEYRAENVFWVPMEARWRHLQDHAKQPTIGKLVDDAMVAIERDNPRLKGVLPKDYARPALDKQRLGELIDLIGTIGLGDAANRSKDILGRVYEYFLSQFASAEGKKGGQFYTPRCVVRVLVEMLAPYKGRGLRSLLRLGRHVRAEREIRRGPRRPDRRHRGLRPGIQPDDTAAGDDESGDPWHRRRLRTGTRRHVPPRPAQGLEGRLRPGESTVQRQRLVPQRRRTSGGSTARRPRATPTSPGSSISSTTCRPPALRASCWPTAHDEFNQSGEGDIRRAIVEADLVDCMVAMPGQLFYSTQIPVCLWFLARNKKDGKRSVTAGARRCSWTRGSWAC